jgi:hypothetical protein
LTNYLVRIFNEVIRPPHINDNKNNDDNDDDDDDDDDDDK